MKHRGTEGWVIIGRCPWDTSLFSFTSRCNPSQRIFNQAKSVVKAQFSSADSV